MKLMLLKVVFLTQKVLLNVSFTFFRLFGPMHKEGVVIGVEEIASILYSAGGALKNAKTVNFYKNPYYDEKYDYYFGQYKVCRALVPLIAPVVLGYLMVRYKTFMYISGNGYLMKHLDGRAYEFSKLKKHECEVICFFTGSDIRSFTRLDAFGKARNMDVITTYQPISHKGIDNTFRENIRKMLGESADKYASAIFNPSTDQMAYIERECHPFLYFADESKIRYLPEKFKQEKKVVLHAPSSPIIKGTPIVRAVIKQLQEEGYDFEYVELMGVSNKEVMAALAKAHIVLNQFYALVPSVFGVEAMMNNAVLLTSADKNLEPTLFDGANEAWVVTPYWRLYKNLKKALDSPMVVLQAQADKGTQWVTRYCSYGFSAKYLQNVIDQLND